MVGRAANAGDRGEASSPRRPSSSDGATLDEAIAAEPNRAKRLLRLVGPGLVTGASDDDPTGIGAYAIAGASFGFATLWAPLATFPLMAATQITCARVGQATGQGMAAVVRTYYSRWLLYPMIGALLVANTVGVGADLGAVAAAVNLL